MSRSRLRFCLVLHNHQPVGNLEEVLEQAWQDSYQPFLDLLGSRPEIRISLHISGPLLLWLEAHRPDYLNQVKHLVDQERIEILGGAFYEPILTMIPSRDRQGQMLARLPIEHASVSLGGARRALDEIADQAVSKRRLRDARTVADKESARIEIGKPSAAPDPTSPANQQTAWAVVALVNVARNGVEVPTRSFKEPTDQPQAKPLPG